MKYFIRIFTTFFLVFTIVFGAGFYFYLDYDDRVKAEEVEQKTDALDTKEVKGERVNVLLLGIDALDGKYEGNSSRTDTMMLLSLDPQTNTSFILSIPRDSRVKIRGRSGMNKVNHAHAYGGVDLALKTTRDLLQIPIHHYIRVDYQALFKTVDDIGGVEIDVPMDMRYKDPYATPPLNININKGLQVLDGQKSMEYLRFRKGYANQDLGRINAQQEFLQALIEKVMSPASVIRIPQYIDTLYTYVDTDMSKKDMLDITREAIRIKPSEIEKHTIPGKSTMISGISYYQINESELAEMIGYLMSGKYLKEEETSDETEEAVETEKTEEAPKAKPVSHTNESSEKVASNIIILNGSGRNGIATRASDLVKISDIKVTRTGNADNFNYEETLIYYKEDKKTAQGIKKALGKGKLIQETNRINGMDFDVLVIVGKDF